MISIIIPVYNAEKYLVQCIESAIDQTWPNKEIIIVDDGSVDNSLSIARRYACDWIKVFSQPNRGASVARNHGLIEAKGDYIQFLDADDLLSNRKIELQAEALDKCPGCVAICNTAHFYDGDDPYNAIPVTEWFSGNNHEPVDFLLKLYGGDLIGEKYGGMTQTNAWLIPSDVIKQAGEWNEELSLDDDGEFFCRVILASRCVCHVEGAINYYRKFSSGTSNLSAKKDYSGMRSILRSTDLKAFHLLKHTDSPIAKAVLARLYHNIAFLAYTEFKDLSKDAEAKANNLYKGLHVQHFVGYKKVILSKLFGWKAISTLLHYTTALRKRFK